MTAERIPAGWRITLAFDLPSGPNDYNLVGWEVRNVANKWLYQVGRLLLGFFTPKRQITRIILTLFGVSIFIFSGLYFLDLGAFTSGAVFLAGLSMSAILPLMLTLAGLLFKEMAGTVLGTIKVAIPIGGILVPFLLSLVSKYGSFQYSLFLFPLSLLTAFIILFSILRSMKEFESAPS